jgi:hypothetical protein
MQKCERPAAVSVSAVRTHPASDTAFEKRPGEVLVPLHSLLLHGMDVARELYAIRRDRELCAALGCDAYVTVEDCLVFLL